MAGSGRLSRVLRHAGYSVASMDIIYWPDQPHSRCSSNPLDMLSASGFAPLDKIQYSVISVNKIPPHPIQTLASQVAIGLCSQNETSIRLALWIGLPVLECYVKGQFIANFFGATWR